MHLEPMQAFHSSIMFPVVRLYPATVPDVVGIAKRTNGHHFVFASSSVMVKPLMALALAVLGRLSASSELGRPYGEPTRCG